MFVFYLSVFLSLRNASPPRRLGQLSSNIEAAHAGPVLENVVSARAIV